MSGVNENKKSLTVKIQLPEDSENILALNFPNTFDVGQLKQDLAGKFKISSDNLLVTQDEDEIRDGHMLCNLNLNDFGIIELKLRLTDTAINDGIKLDTGIYYSSFTLPDIITVHIPIENEDGEVTIRDLVVEIENKSIKKPFLGGFLHKKTSKGCKLFIRQLNLNSKPFQTSSIITRSPKLGLTWIKFLKSKIKSCVEKRKQSNCDELRS